LGLGEPTREVNREKAKRNKTATKRTGREGREKETWKRAKKVKISAQKKGQGQRSTVGDSKLANSTRDRLEGRGGQKKRRL